MPHPQSQSLAPENGNLDFNQIMQLWSQFSPEAQTAQQLHAMQIQEQAMKIQQMQAAMQYAQSLGFPSVEALQLHQQGQLQDSRIQESRDYHTAQMHELTDKQHQVADQRVMPLFMGKDGQIDPVALAKYVQARGAGKEQEFLGNFIATKEGQGRAGQTLQTPAAKRNPKQWEDLWTYGDPNVVATELPNLPKDANFWNQSSTSASPTPTTPTTPSTPASFPGIIPLLGQGGEAGGNPLAPSTGMKFNSELTPAERAAMSPEQMAQRQDVFSGIHPLLHFMSQFLFGNQPQT